MPGHDFKEHLSCEASGGPRDIYLYIDLLDINWSYVIEIMFSKAGLVLKQI